MSDCESGVSSYDLESSNASNISGFFTEKLQSCGDCTWGAFMGFSTCLKEKCYLSRKCMFWLFFFILAVVILGLLAELHSKWGSDRVDSRVLGSTDAPVIEELPFLDP